MGRIVIASFDGACEPNPGGHMGLGWVLDGQSHYRYIAPHFGNTNNTAEYLALMEVLQATLLEECITSLKVSGDSNVVVSQLSGEYAVRSPNLYSLWQRAMELQDALEARGCSVSINWHPRDENADADAASKLALTEQGVVIVDWSARQRKPEFQVARNSLRKSNGVSDAQRTAWTRLEGLADQEVVRSTGYSRDVPFE